LQSVLRHCNYPPFPSTRIDAESKEDPVPIHEEPHRNDWQRAVLLADAVLLVILRFFNFKIKVGAVIIDDLCFALCNCHTVFEESALDIARFGGEDRQSPVNLVQFKIRLFNKAFGVLVRTQLG